MRRLSGEGLNGNEIAKRLRISHFSAYRFLAANANKWEEPPPIVDAPIENWCIHDLRRSFATGLAKLGVATSTIAQLLNHREGGITKIYNRYSYLENKRSAMDLWGRHIESLISPPEDNAVEILRST